MSFRSYKTFVKEGDTVILYFSNQVFAIQVVPLIKNRKGNMVENVFQTNFGALKVISLVGVEYGSKVELSKGWGHILQPTPELWSLTLPHRTQIIYTPDISMILIQLDLVPGSVVIEAGTGSGSLTHALIRSVRPHGHVHTFDFHEVRAALARTEFEEHGLADFVSAKQRDVCDDGFGEELDGKADAVFLDLPCPWKGVSHAVKAMKNEGGRFCSFSPCIEQVQRTCLALKDHGFEDLATMEVLQTELKVTRRTIPVREIAFLKQKRKTILYWIRRNEETGGDLTPHHRQLYQRATTANEDGAIVAAHTANPFRSTALTAADYNSSDCPISEKASGERNYVVASWPQSTNGHTGYLTLATLPPAFRRSKSRKVHVTTEPLEEEKNGHLVIDTEMDVK